MAADASQPPAQPQPPTAPWTESFDRPPTKAELAAAAAADRPMPENASDQKPPPPRPTLSEAARTIRLQDFKNVYQVPCAREGFLTGIGGGAVLGMLRYVGGAPISTATNWAVGAFAAGGIAAFEWCQAQRRAERAKMRRVVEVYDRRQQAEKAATAAAALKRRQEEEAEAKAREEAERARRRWYKFW